MGSIQDSFKIQRRNYYENWLILAKIVAEIKVAPFLTYGNSCKRLSIHQSVAGDIYDAIAAKTFRNLATFTFDHLTSATQFLAYVTRLILHHTRKSCLL